MSGAQTLRKCCCQGEPGYATSPLASDVALADDDDEPFSLLFCVSDLRHKRLGAPQCPIGIETSVLPHWCPPRHRGTDRFSPLAAMSLPELGLGDILVKETVLTIPTCLWQFSWRDPPRSPTRGVSPDGDMDWPLLSCCKTSLKKKSSFKTDRSSMQSTQSILTSLP
jgi:hypothetical protein